MDQFIDQIDDNALVQFNGKYLIDGSKNNAFISSKTVLLNQSLSIDTLSNSALTLLKNRAGDSLEIQTSDYYTVSWVHNGITSTTSARVDSVSLQTLLELSGGNIVQASSSVKIGEDKFNVDLYTPDKTAGIALVAATAGMTNQISGFTISIMDSDGNVKKAANAALDQFKQYQRAENKTGDKALTFHIGPNANVAIKVGMQDMRAQALGLKGSVERLSVRTKEDANAAINVIENALTKALDQQIDIGSVLSRLDYTKSNIITAG